MMSKIKIYTIIVFSLFLNSLFSQEIREVGSVRTPGGAADVALRANYAYVADVHAGLCIVDISDRENPEIISELGPETLWSTRGVTVDETFVYVMDIGVLCVIDVSDPINPFILGSYDTEKRGYAGSDISINEGYVYLADRSDGLRIFDVSNPENPSQVGLCDTPDQALGVAIAGNYAYLAVRISSLYVIDITNPGDPTIVGNCDVPNRAFDVAINDNSAFIAEGARGYQAGSLRIINVSNPEDPFEVGYYNTPGEVEGVAVSGSFAYITEGSNGLRIIDISDLNDPAEVAHYDTQGDARNLIVAGDYAYLVNGGGLIILDVSDFTEVDDESERSNTMKYSLANAYPNPFNSITSLSLQCRKGRTSVCVSTTLKAGWSRLSSTA